MHIMESLLSTTECRKSTKNSFQASHSGPLRAAKKQKNHQDFNADGSAASKDTFFFDFGGRLLDRWGSSSLALFSSAIYSCQGDLAISFTCLHPSKQAKKAHVHADHLDGDFYCRFEVHTNATAVVSLVKRILFLLFWERRNRQRALRDLTCGFLVATIDEAYVYQ